MLWAGVPSRIFLSSSSVSATAAYALHGSSTRDKNPSDTKALSRYFSIMWRCGVSRRSCQLYPMARIHLTSQNHYCSHGEQTGQSERTSLGNRLPRVRNIVAVNVGSATTAEIWWRCKLDLPPPGNLQVATVTMGCLHWLMKTSLLPLLPQVDPIRWCIQPYLSPYTCASWPLTPTWPQLPLAD